MGAASAPPRARATSRTPSPAPPPARPLSRSPRRRPRRRRSPPGRRCRLQRPSSRPRRRRCPPLRTAPTTTSLAHQTRRRPSPTLRAPSGCALGQLSRPVRRRGGRHDPGDISQAQLLPSCRRRRSRVHDISRTCLSRWNRYQPSSSPPAWHGGAPGNAAARRHQVRHRLLLHGKHGDQPAHAGHQQRPRHAPREQRRLRGGAVVLVPLLHKLRGLSLARGRDAPHAFTSPPLSPLPSRLPALARAALAAADEGAVSRRATSAPRCDDDLTPVMGISPHTG